MILSKIFDICRNRPRGLRFTESSFSKNRIFYFFCFLAVFLSLCTILSFSTSVILLRIHSLPLKYGLISLWYVLLPGKRFHSNFSWSFIWFFSINSHASYFVVSISTNSHNIYLYWKHFFSFDRNIISSLDMKELLLRFNILVFSSACLLKTSRNVFPNGQYMLLSITLLILSFRISLKATILKVLFYLYFSLVFPWNWLMSLLPPIRAAEIVECVCKYVDGISQNLQNVSPY